VRRDVLWGAEKKKGKMRTVNQIKDNIEGEHTANLRFGGGRKTSKTVRAQEL